MSFLEVDITFKTQVMAVLLFLGIVFAMRAVRNSIKSFEGLAGGPMPYRVEAKKNLRRLHKLFEKNFDESGSYMNATIDFYQYKTDRYRFGDINKLPKLKKYCEDCIIDNATFRIGAIANLDDDAKLDILTINEYGVLEVISDDIGGKN